MNDDRDLKMFTRPGRHLVLRAASDPSHPIALVTCWRDTLTQEENVRLLRDLGTRRRPRLLDPGVREALIAANHQNLPWAVTTTFVYGTDYRGHSAFLLLCSEVTGDPGVTLLHAPCRQIVKLFDQPGHIEWDGAEAAYIARDRTRSLVAPFDMTVDRLDVWFSVIRPDFHAAGIIDRSVSYVQRRWHKTQPTDGMNG